MKKLILMATALFASIGVYADYPSMEFTTDKGTKFLIAAENLSITINGDKVIATNENENLEFDASELTMMRFSTEKSAGVESVTDLNEGPVTFYTTDGKIAGQFNSMDDARTNLDGGIYIVKLENGGSLKINIKK